MQPRRPLPFHSDGIKKRFSVFSLRNTFIGIPFPKLLLKKRVMVFDISTIGREVRYVTSPNFIRKSSSHTPHDSAGDPGSTFRIITMGSKSS